MSARTEDDKERNAGDRHHTEDQGDVMERQRGRIMVGSRLCLTMYILRTRINVLLPHDCVREVDGTIDERGEVEVTTISLY